MVFQVGAVLPFIIFRAVTEIVHSKVEALGTVLARIWLTIIYVQLSEEIKREEKKKGGGRLSETEVLS